MKKVKEVHGEKYEEFMMKKLVAIPGNICESDLGIDPLTANHIANNVHVIVNSAATTNFDERYDMALSVNTKGPSHLLSFAKTCKNVCLFLHISTAYVNDGRVGKIEETTLVPMLDIEKEMKLVSSLMDDSVQENQHSNQNMKQLGLQRAKIHGWKSCYTFSKAMGEMKITSMIGDIPIVILRPSIIESTYKEPFPGWIEGNRSSFACRLPWSVLLSLGSLCSSDMSQQNWLFKDGRIRRTRCREDDDGGGGGGRWRR
ncbi:fatty acyl-CoA reductase 2-like [Senna tora]|uniref:Fatty acyl-CoA reductase n=1 Tax=Senna tora TaxID=362788 RepID=A0A835CBS5_9FABA|nr:fatty acyl-CoA reductase 2-like [Senna tora]